MDAILEALNTEQKKAVTSPAQHLLILAGAGSGKTKVLTHRVAWVIQNKQATADKCLLLTFTNKAANEMKERMQKLLSNAGLPAKTAPLALWAGTFHSFCVRILRINGDSIGVPKNFVIYDDEDQKDAVKRIIQEKNLPTELATPAGFVGAISDIKNQMMDPAEYKKFAQGEYQRTLSVIYEHYQKNLHEIGALDFDDLLIKTVELFKKAPEVLARWQRQLPWVFVDEWQDTNKIQYRLVKLLVSPTSHLTVVGDFSQCLPPETTIETFNGKKHIKDIKVGDLVVSATGRGLSGFFPVTSVHKRKYEGDLVKIETGTKNSILLTPNHILFARLVPTENLYHVYLMYRHDKGYRIGLAKGIRAGCAANHYKPKVGISTRGNQESADKMWILKTCKDRAEANYWEMYFSIKFGVPTLVFDTGGRAMKLSQGQIDNFFSRIDTISHAQDLMKHLHLDPRFPHYRPRGISGYRDRDRQVIHLKFFEDSRITQQSPWCMHRLALNTTDKTLENNIKNAGYYTRPGRKNTWRTEICRLSYDEIENIAQKMSELGGNLEISYEAFFLEKDKLFFQPASHIQPEMGIPIFSNKRIKEARVTKVGYKPYSGFVYDLEVDKSHNYIANNIVVHNSIYSWRGADFRNLNYLSRDFPKIETVNLEQNYRSTQIILEAANCVICKNKNHPILKLWTENENGEKITVFSASSGYEEAEWAVKQISSIGTSLNEVAILYRTNAQSRLLEEALLHKSLPYTVVGGFRFYERKEIKDLVACLRLLTNPKDRASLERVKKLGVRRSARLAEIQDHVIPDSLSFPRKRESIQNNSGSPIGSGMTQEQHGMTTSKLLNLVIEKLNYLDIYKADTEENFARLENIKELMSVAAEFPDCLDFLSQVALVETQKDSDKTAHDRVTLMTVHSAKGLEFKVVFIVGLEEGLFPHSRSLGDSMQMEEERRLAYVGITRAKKKLYLSFAQRRSYFGQSATNPPSRFFEDIPGHLLDGTIFAPNLPAQAGLPDDTGISHEPVDTGFDDILDKYLE